MDTFTRKATLSKRFWFPLLVLVYSWEYLPPPEHVFPFRIDRYSKGLKAQLVNRKSTKQVKNWKKSIVQIML